MFLGKWKDELEVRKYGQDRSRRSGNGEYRNHHGEGRDDSNHHSGGHYGGRQGNGYLTLAEPEGTHLLFIGSRSCFRHKGTQKLQLLQEGRLSFLCLEEIDWITGSYLYLIEQAAEELIQDLNPKHLVLFGGCQIELLSTDYDAISKGLSDKYSMDVHFHRGCHLTGYGEALGEKLKDNERLGGSEE